MNYYRHWKIRYIDKWTNGEIRETEAHGYYDRDSVIKSFGLNDPEVSWYEIKEMKGWNDEKNEE